MMKKSLKYYLISIIPYFYELDLWVKSKTLNWLKKKF